MAVDHQLRADARRNRERIIAAARVAFAEHGLDVGVAEIAHRAGVGTATLFRRFPTKQDLVVAVMEECMAQMQELVARAGETEDPVAALEELLAASCLIHVEDQGLIEATKAQFHGDARLMAMRDEVMAAFGAVLERAKAAGAVREDVEPVDLMMLVNGIATVVSWVGPDHRHLHRRYLAVVLAGIRPRADDVALEPPAPTLEQIDGAMRALAARRPDG